MESIRMPALKFAKKLKTRLAELKKRRPGEIAKYNEDVYEWKIRMARWCVDNVPARIESTTRTELKASEGRYNKIGFNSERFFKGAPLPPVSPMRSKKQMDLIRVQLRKIAITGQESIYLDDRDIENLFGDKAVD